MGARSSHLRNLAGRPTKTSPGLSLERIMAVSVHPVEGQNILLTIGHREPPVYKWRGGLGYPHQLSQRDPWTSGLLVYWAWISRSGWLLGVSIFIMMLAMFDLFELTRVSDSRMQNGVHALSCQAAGKKMGMHFPESLLHGELN